MYNPTDNPIPPAIESPGGEKSLTPHPEWAAHRRRWRWMLDSYEGGEVYRDATYGGDSRGMPVRNLVRHKREYPLTDHDAAYAVGSLAADAYATDDPYEMRRARTTVPGFVREAVEAHLSKIYNREPRRKAPPAIEAWWADVDGLATSIDQWMKDSIAPLLLVLGQVDLLFDRPPVPEGERVRTRADERRLGLDACVASYVLPENLPWWKVDRKGRYTEALVREVGDAGATWVLWTPETWTRFDDKGKSADGPVGHGYGVVPIVRCFDRRRFRCRNVGYSRYEGIAEKQRDAYNRESELIVSDTTQAHPTMLMPEKWLDGEIPVGPSYSLPITVDPATGTTVKPEYMDPPKGAADSLRLNLAAIRDAADRDACLTKPAGASGTTGSTVSQSGASKRIDQNRGDELLGAIAKSLQRCEEAAVAMAMRVAEPGVEPDMDSYEISYPAEFDLSSPEEKIDRMERFAGWLASAGDCPKTQHMMAADFLRDAYRGLDDSTYAELEAEVMAFLKGRADASEEGRRVDEAAALRLRPADADPDEDDEDDDGPDTEEDEDI